MLINATVQYPPCSIQIITECAETTKVDFQEGIQDVTKGYSVPSKKILSSDFTVRSLDSLGDVLDDDIRFYYQYLTEANLLKKFTLSQSFTFFKQIYLKFSYYPPKFKLLTQLLELYETEENASNKRSIKKAYYWIRNSTERVYVYYKLYVQNCVASSEIMYEFSKEEFDLKSMKTEVLKTLQKNIECINVLDYLCNVFREIQNPKIGTTTSRIALFTMYQLSGCLHRLYEKHSLAHKCLIKHLLNEEPNPFPDYKYKIMNDAAIIVNLFQNNLHAMHFCISAVIYFTEASLPITCKIIANRKTSHCFPLEFSAFDYDQRYHFKALLCFNTQEMFNFYGSVHVGTADYYPTDLPEMLRKMLSTPDHIHELTFYGEVSNVILRAVLQRINDSQHDLANMWKAFITELESTTKFDEKKVKEATNNVAKFNYFIDKRNKESGLQVSYLSIYSSVTIDSLKTLNMLDETYKSMEPGVTQGATQKIFFAAYKYFYKNLFDLVYFAIFRLGKYIYYLKEIFTNEISSWSEQYNAKYIMLLIQNIKEELNEVGKCLTDNSNGDPQLITLLDNLQILNALEEDNYKNIYEILIVIRNGLVNLENFTFINDIRLTFRKDRTF